MSREKKDFYLSMYLFERGKDSMSMITDLFRYKGEHTKESRVFQSRMRFDFEAFVTIFLQHLIDGASRIGKIFKVNIGGERAEFEAWIKQKIEDAKENELNWIRQLDYSDFCDALIDDQRHEYSEEKRALIQGAIFDLDEAESIRKSVDNITKARMAQQGFGVYVDKNGRPFSVNDEGLDEIIKQDRELQQQAEEEQR